MYDVMNYCVLHERRWPVSCCVSVTKVELLKVETAAAVVGVLLSAAERWVIVDWWIAAAEADVSDICLSYRRRLFTERLYQSTPDTAAV